MLFNLIIFVLFAAVAYFHYTQGLFSATLSAVICIFAAMLAVGYHELITPFLMKLPEEADAIALLGIFAVAYGIMRILFDQIVPGNIRFPLLMDKIGAGVMGLLAGIFSTGLLALAAQSMPFGASIGGFARQELADQRPITVPGDATGTSHAADAIVTDEMKGDHLGDTQYQDGLWLHQDSMLLALARQLSDPGSAFANDRPLEAAHPDYLMELFGQRLGVPIGAKHVAAGGISVSGAYVLSPLPPSMMMDSEIPAVRNPDLPLPDLQLASGPSVALVVRASFSGSDLPDIDQILRTTPGGIRLKAGANDYWPIGTLVGGKLLLKNRPDDSLLINLKTGGQTVDFVFVVSTDDLNITTDNKQKTTRFKEGSFLEVKRFARQDLSGKELDPEAPPTKFESDKDFASAGSLGGVLRKISVGEKALALLGHAGISSTQPGSSSSSSKNQPATPNNGNKSNDLLPELPNHMMGM